MSVVLGLHQAGFFSCCSVRLHEIIAYINKFNKLPLNVNSSELFSWYKCGANTDITDEYFQNYNDIVLENLKSPVDYFEWYQFSDYSNLDYLNIIPIVKKYFSPSEQIQEIIRTIEQKYNIDYENTCALFYRGNDKSTETKLSEYSEYLPHIQSITAKNPESKFLIQSDETEFIEEMSRLLPQKSFFLKDEIRHIPKSKTTVDVVFKDKNFVFSKYFLAITMIMSKCKYVICGSGNCSIWIMLFRENCNNVYQYYNDKMLIHKTDTDWKTVAREGEEVSIGLDKRIRYGALNCGWIEKNNDVETFVVSNEHFGRDPAMNIKKVLQMRIHT